METSPTVYSAFDQLEPAQCINSGPETLRALLKGPIVGKGVQTKIASTELAIMQAAQP